MATAVSKYTPQGSTLTLGGGSGPSGGGSDFGTILADLLSRAMAARAQREDVAKREAEVAANKQATARQEAIAHAARQERRARGLPATSVPTFGQASPAAQAEDRARTAEAKARTQGAYSATRPPPTVQNPSDWVYGHHSGYGLDPSRMDAVQRQLYLPQGNSLSGGMTGTEASGLASADYWGSRIAQDRQRALAGG